MSDLSNARESFERRIDDAEKLVSNVEALWQTAPRGSDVRRQIGDGELCALYEMAYLSIFGNWENFIEECLTRMLVGQGCASYSVVLVNPPRSSSLRAARARVLGGNPYLLWHNPARSIARIASHVAGSPLESALAASETAIEQYAAIRHAVAHRSEDTQTAFRAASMSMTGVVYASPGRLLRTQDQRDPLNPVRWIRNISSDLRRVASAATT